MPEGDTPMKVGIISPRILIRRALSTFLASTGTALVVMEGSDFHDCLEEIKQSQADTLIIDVCGSGPDMFPDLSELGHDRKVVLLMDDVDTAAAARAFELGIWGCLSTKQTPAIFHKALNSLAHGERWISPGASDEIQGSTGKGSRLSKAPEELTPREWEVLGLLANGFRNKEISARLSISEETAKTHIKSIYKKLNIKGRRDAIFRYFGYVHSSLEEVAVKPAMVANQPAPVNSRKN